MNDVKRYSGLAIFFHWSIAVLIFTLMAMGWTMEAMDKGPTAFFLFSLHKLLGCITLALVICRYGWRALNKPPADLPSIPGWQSRIAGVVHFLLYAAMLVMPLSGALFVNFGHGISFFGIKLPQVGADWAKQSALQPGHLLQQVHNTVPYMLAALLIMHIGAALWHHYVQRDAMLKRMLPAD